MSELPDWTPPDVGAILAQFEAQTPAQMRQELLDQYIASGNHTALRSLFDSMYHARNRAEYLSNTLIAYIHAQVRKEPHVKEYFQKQMAEYDLEGKRMKAERLEAAGRIRSHTGASASAGAKRPRIRTPASEPAEALDW